MLTVLVPFLSPCSKHLHRVVKSPSLYNVSRGSAASLLWLVTREYIHGHAHFSPLFSAGLTQEAALFATELRSCVKVEVAVLGSPSLIVLMVSVDVKQH